MVKVAPSRHGSELDLGRERAEVRRRVPRRVQLGQLVGRVHEERRIVFCLISGTCDRVRRRRRGTRDTERGAQRLGGAERLSTVARHLIERGNRGSSSSWCRTRTRGRRCRRWSPPASCRWHTQPLNRSAWRCPRARASDRSRTGRGRWHHGERRSQAGHPSRMWPRGGPKRRGHGTPLFDCIRRNAVHGVQDTFGYAAPRTVSARWPPALQRQGSGIPRPGDTSGPGRARACGGYPK